MNLSLVTFVFLAQLNRKGCVATSTRLRTNFFAGSDLEPGKLDYTQIKAKELHGRNLTLTGFTKGNHVHIVKLTIESLT